MKSWNTPEYWSTSSKVNAEVQRILKIWAVQDPCIRQVQTVFQSIEPQNVSSTAVFKSIEPKNTGSTSSIQSIQPRNIFKHKQSLEYWPPKHLKYKPYLEYWTPKHLGPRSTYPCTASTGSTGRIRRIELKHSQNAQFKHHLFSFQAWGSCRVAITIPQMLRVYSILLSILGVSSIFRTPSTESIRVLAA